MERAESPNEMEAIDGDDFTIRKTRGEDRVRFRITPRLPEIRHQHRTVDDEKIRVARRDALAAKREWFRHR